MVKVNEISIENKIAESTKIMSEMFSVSLTKRQMDLIYAVISLVKPTDTEFKEYVITYKQIAELYNPSNSRSKEIKKCVKDAINGIMDSHFDMVDGDEVVSYHWVEKCRNNDKKEIITFKLNKEVQQFYLKLNTGDYTVFLLKDLLELSSVFQANLFKWLTCKSGFSNAVPISIDDAKLHFYGKSDLKTSEFIKKIDSALEKINEKTNITASYEKVKSGKTITSLKFTIDNEYIKQKKPLTPAQKKANDERSKAMWQENQELKEEIARLKAMYEKEVV